MTEAVADVLEIPQPLRADLVLHQHDGPTFRLTRAYSLSRSSLREGRRVSANEAIQALLKRCGNVTQAFDGARGRPDGQAHLILQVLQDYIAQRGGEEEEDAEFIPWETRSILLPQIHFAKACFSFFENHFKRYLRRSY